MVRFLLAKGINPNIEDGDKRTPLFYVSSRGRQSAYQSIIMQLVQAGAVLDHQDRGGWTAIFWAAVHNELAILQLLHELGASLNLTDDLNRNVLYNVCFYNLKKIFTYLCDNGIDVTVQDVNDMTPLHYAILHRCDDFVEPLVQRGADVNLGDKHGQTPLHYAMEQQAKKILRTLIDSGADPDIKNNNGQLPVDLIPAGLNAEQRRMLEYALFFEIDLSEPSLLKVSSSPMLPASSKVSSKKTVNYWYFEWLIGALVFAFGLGGLPAWAGFSFPLIGLFWTQMILAAIGFVVASLLVAGAQLISQSIMWVCFEEDGPEKQSITGINRKVFSEQTKNTPALSIQLELSEIKSVLHACFLDVVSDRKSKVSQAIPLSEENGKRLEKGNGLS